MNSQNVIEACILEELARQRLTTRHAEYCVPVPLAKYIDANLTYVMRNIKSAKKILSEAGFRQYISDCYSSRWEIHARENRDGKAGEEGNDLPF